jgi:hypothetical protein
MTFRGRLSLPACAAWLLAASPAAIAQDQLWSVAGAASNGDFPTRMQAFRDYDGDGVLDVWASEQAVGLNVFSGASGQLLYSPNAALTSYSFLGAFDWGGDGIDDYLCMSLSFPPAGSVRDGKTGKARFATNSDYPIVARDVDGDGKPEIAGLVSPDHVVLSRGSDGSVLWSATVATRGLALLVVADRNGDGVDDLACTSDAPPAGQGSLVLLSMSDGSLLSAGGPAVTGLTTWTKLGRDVDRDGDGRDDWIVANQLEGGTPGTPHRGAVWLVSSASLATLRRIDGRPGAALDFQCVAGDVDGDGCSDLALHYTPSQDLDHPVIELRSGRTWRPLAWLQSDAMRPYTPSLESRPIGDADGDGFDDLVVGRYDDDKLTCDRGRPAFLSLYPYSKELPPPMNGQRDALADYAFELLVTGFKPGSLVLIDWTEYWGAPYGPVRLLSTHANALGEVAGAVLVPPVPGGARPQLFGLQAIGMTPSGAPITSNVERCAYW